MLSLLGMGLLFQKKSCYKERTENRKEGKEEDIARKLDRTKRESDKIKCDSVTENLCSQEEMT